MPRQEDALAMRNQFRRLKWPVFDEVTLRRRDGLPLAGAIMVASALPGEGKTYTSCNLAMSMAREDDRRVVLIDCDIAKPQLSEVLGLGEKSGLTDYLANPAMSVADILSTTNVDRLYFIPSGKPVAHVAELISSARMYQLLHELTSAGPGVVVVLDTSPVMATNEAQALARLVPQIILVVRADKTPQPTVLEACDILGREKTSAVLNQAHVWSDTEAYQTGYGYYANEERERKQ
jgi:exopolysaccharide/PEP-CTERM locus tyrosine autokinase